jgi:uncharacterized protein YggE
MEQNKPYKNMLQSSSIALLCISFAAVTFGFNNLDEMKHPSGQIASISVSGEGETTAIPDIATVSFTVRESAKTVPEAQKAVESKISKGLKDLEVLGVEKKDVKTLSYVVNPKYEQQGAGICNAFSCPPVKSVVVGYEVSQSVTVKVRKVDQAGEVLGILGKTNITEISGPEFTVNDMETVKAEAKVIAIKKAQAKAEEEAKALGVSLGAILSFSEDNNGGYYPVMYSAKAMSSDSREAGVTATLPAGENIIKSKVTITYTIK